MINLSTGLPGAGKTLFTIAFVKELADKEKRPVFYSGITDLALDWQEIDAEKWMDAPDGALIVIDECQRIFRPRGSAAKVPEYVSALETHRHKGLDLFLISEAAAGAAVGLPDFQNFRSLRFLRFLRFAPGRRGF
jgi:hypothetical protein